MRNHAFADLDRVVALGDRHGLGQVMSSLSSLGSRLTGIVTTTDNEGSTGQIRRSEGGIAQDDVRSCIDQLIAEPSVTSAMLEYRFSGDGELSRHNLGSLMLKALDHLSVWPLETISLIRNPLKVNAFLISMSEQPVDLTTLDHEGHEVYGEMDIDQLDSLPQELMLTPPVSATHRSVEAIIEADLILISPDGFCTSLLPILLLDEMAQALCRTPAPMVFIDNLSKEHGPAAGLSLAERVAIMERYVGERVVDAMITGSKADIRGINDWLVIQTPLEANDVPYHHDRALLRGTLRKAVQLPG